MTNSNIQVAEFQMIIFLSKDLNTVKKKIDWNGETHTSTFCMKT